MIITYQAEPVR